MVEGEDRAYLVSEVDERLAYLARPEIPRTVRLTAGWRALRGSPGSLKRWRQVMSVWSPPWTAAGP